MKSLKKTFKSLVLLGLLIINALIFIPSCTQNGQNLGISADNIDSTQIMAATISGTEPRNGNGEEVLLQGFHWDSARVGSWYNVMANNASKMQEAGITMIWSPPPWRDESQWGTGDQTWGGATGGGGEGYFWYRFNLNSKYGSESELNNMISAMGNNNIKVIVDIVANHAHRFHSNPQWPTDSNKWRENAWEDGYVFAEDSEINTGNAYDDILSALNTLKGKGVVGWRWDICHGYPKERTHDWNSATDAEFSVGEYEWTGYHAIAGNLEDWCAAANSTGFDFYEKWNLNTATPSTFGGLHTNERAEARERAVTFVENHDSQITRANGNNAPDDSMGARSKCYAFILLTPGTPCVFWKDLMEGGVGYEWLKSIIWLRRNAGIRANSEILSNETSGSGRAIIVEGTNYNVALALDWPDWTPSGSSWTKSSSSAWGGYLNIWTGAGGGSTTTTTVYVHYDVGWGNEMYIRGDTSPLSWDSGIHMTNVDSDTWMWETTAITAGQKLEFKPLINDSNWSSGSNYWHYGGQTIDVYPSF